MLAEHPETFATKHDLKIAMINLEAQRHRTMFKATLVLYVCTNAVLWGTAVAVLR